MIHPSPFIQTYKSHPYPPPPPSPPTHNQHNSRSSRGAEKEKDLSELFVIIQQVIQILREVFPASFYAKQFLSLWKWLGRLQVCDFDLFICLPTYLPTILSQIPTYVHT